MANKKTKVEYQSIKVGELGEMTVEEAEYVAELIEHFTQVKVEVK